MYFDVAISVRIPWLYHFIKSDLSQAMTMAEVSDPSQIYLRSTSSSEPVCKGYFTGYFLPASSKGTDWYLAI